MTVFRPKEQNIARTVEVLFEGRTVLEIKQFEDKTRRDIEDKKSQLKQLVGDSHSDVIGCTNQILAMATRCDEIIQSLGTMQDRLSNLVSTGGNRRSSSVMDAFDALSPRSRNERGDASKRATLFAVGARVKFLLDTTEMIWGHLDAAELLQASARFTRACLIHSELENPREISPSLSGTFPLVKSQWPAIAKLQGEIEDRCTAALRPAHAQHVLTAATAAEALAALSVLRSDLSHAQALELLLHSAAERLTAALQPGEFAAAATTDPSVSPAVAAAKQLAAAARLIQDAITLVGAVFSGLGPSSPSPSSSGAPTGRLAAVFHPSAASEGFDPRPWEDLPPMPGRPHLRASEVDAWAALLEGVAARLAPGASQGDALRARCARWIEDAASEFQRRAVAVLRESCRDPKDLALLEETCQAELAAWTAAPVLASPSDGPAPAADPSSPASWPAVSQAVLGRVFNPWAELLENPFVARAQSLLDAICQRTLAAVKESLQLQLDQAAAGAAEVPVLTQLGEGLRTALAMVCELGQIKAGAPERNGNALPSSLARSGGSSAFRRQSSASLGPDDSPRSPSSAHAGSNGVTAVPEGLSSRAGKLGPHLQSSVLALTRELSHALEFHLSEVQRASTTAAAAASTADPAAARRAIVLGRVALALTLPGSLLPAVLASSYDRWPRIAADPEAALAPGTEDASGLRRASSLAASTSAPRPSASSPAPSSSEAALQEVSSALRAAAFSAFSLWSRAHAKGLARELARGLRSDPCMAAKDAPAHWHRVKVASGDAGDVDFALPASPSPALAWVLLAAARELQAQLGASSASSRFLQAAQLLPVHQQYLWEAQAALLQCYREEVAEGAGAGAVQDAGSLQALFDVRFLRDALSGGAPPPPPAQAAAGPQTEAQVQAALAPVLLARRQQGLQLEDALSSRLDPIDWATYEPHLFALVNQALQRTSLLLGVLLQCSRTVMARPEMAKLSPPMDVPSLALAPTAHRFAYLPVAMPGGSIAAAAAAAALPSARRTALAGGAADAGAAEGQGDFCGAGSFADLFTPVSGPAAWKSVRAPGLAAAAEASTNSISASGVAPGSLGEVDSSAYGLMTSLRGKVGELASSRVLGSIGLPVDLNLGAVGSFFSGGGSS